MIRNKAQVQDYLLKKLKDSSASVLEVYLVSQDGLVIVSTSGDAASSNRVAALASSVYMPAKRAAQELPFEELNFVVASGSKQNLYLKGIGEGQLLAVLVKSGADWQKIQQQIIKTSQDLRYITRSKDET
jgi:predicted regulator of Ras-like GTPase activity (Roadblock/LC7/MglB family)